MIELVILRSTGGAEKLGDYMNEHDQLFDDENFIEAVKFISAKMGAPLKMVESDSWKK